MRSTLYLWLFLVQSLVALEPSWSWQPVTNQTPPKPKTKQWAWNSVDHFLLKVWEQEKLPLPQTTSLERRLRRMSYVLRGLPPERSDWQYLQEQGEEALDKIMDRYLASRRFAERWARHWLDVVRYADTSGGGRSYHFQEAWRYRQFVIDSFDQDKPYALFIQQQIAGDQLPYKNESQRRENLIATGFLQLGPKELAEYDKLKLKMDVVDEQLHTIGTSMMGLSLSCARCHDHKFDAVSTIDYYAMAGVFSSTRTLNGTMGLNGSIFSDWFRKPLELNAQEYKQYLQIKNEISELGKTIHRTSRAINKLKKLKDDKNDKKITELTAKLKDSKRKHSQLKKSPLMQSTLVMCVEDEAKPRDLAVMKRGNPRSLGDRVKRGAIAQFASMHVISEGESGRLAFAHWLSDAKHPLTYRVMVNRIWQHVFGRGLVATVNNFGNTGAKPDHPELLDWLTHQFIANDTSLKSLLKLLLSSHLFAVESHSGDEQARAKPEWFHHYLSRRLDAESLRDSMLKVSGEWCEPSRWQPVVNTSRDPNYLVKPEHFDPDSMKGWPSIYLPVIRNQNFNFTNMLKLFDAANPNMSVGQRKVSSLPTQALYLLNAPEMENWSRAAVKRIKSQSQNAEQFLQEAAVLLWGRSIQDNEKHLMSQLMPSSLEEESELTRVIQVMLMSHSFTFIL